MKTLLGHLAASLVLAAMLGGSNPALAQKALTFEERVKAQEAIERVFYNHRIWPKENPQPKPPFEQMVPRSVIEAKVTDYLKKCAALERGRNNPIQPEELRAEVGRMKRQTQDPGTLRELFSALGDNPVLVAECLARPSLAARRAGTDANGAAPESIDPACDGHWGWLSTQGAPAPRSEHYAVWTGAEMIVWGGQTGEDVGSGGCYVPATASWSPTSIGANCPASLYEGVACWTGTEMIVWGGRLPDGQTSSSGCRYNPISDSWLPVSAAGACPSPRYYTAGVWTGTEMIVWGGWASSGAFLSDGSRYSPATDAWTPVTSAGAPAGRFAHTAVWTGTEMIIWGGTGPGNVAQDGGLYNPLTDAWRPTSSQGDVPQGRAFHTAVWTGSEMIVWGGNAADQLADGGRYNPVSDSWRAMTGEGAPPKRNRHTAVWTGSQMIVWGGDWMAGGTDYYRDDGGRYLPDGDAWITVPSGNGGPAGRTEHTAVWTGSAMLIWGGWGENAGGYVQYGDGGAYILPATPAPSGVPQCAAEDVSPCSLGIKVSWPVDPTAWNDSGVVQYRGYRVVRDGSYLDNGACSGLLAYGTTSCTDASTPQGGTYGYTVRYVNSCGISAAGPEASVQDVYILPPPPTSGPYPPDGASAVGSVPLLQWAPVDGATSYDVYLGTADPPPLLASVSTTSYTPAVLGGPTVYFWKVVPANICGTASGCPTWSFTTVAPPLIAAVKKLSDPFRLKLTGSNFQTGAAVRINGQAVPETDVKSTALLFAKKGGALKSLLPKGTPVCVTVSNPDQGVCACYTYTR